MFVKRGLKTKLVVYYEATMSMSTVAVFKLTHAIPWHMLGLLLYRNNMCIWSQI